MKDVKVICALLFTVWLFYCAH